MPDRRDRERPAEESLRAWLRAGDPAGDGAGLSPTDLARLRRSLRDAAPTTRGVPRSLVPALAAAAGVSLMAVLAVLIGQRGASPPGPGPSPRAGAELATLASPPPASRRSGVPHQIQFTTARGTRVIWTLTAEREVER